MGWLSETLTTVAFCWRVERRDGVAVGLTSHDRDLVVDGLLHRASPGMTPSAIRREEGLEADTADVGAALSSALIGEADLLAGRWDGARVVLSAVDWTEPSRRVPLSEGTIGAVELTDGGFTAELRGVAAALERAVVEETSPECRAELGDRRCRVPMAGRRRVARVVEADGELVMLDAHEPEPDAYGGGRLRWFGGANAGLEGAVARSEGARVVLRAPPAFEAEPGTLVELVEGCAKSLDVCRGRFGNGVNFRGEPFLPGMDLLTRYPGRVTPSGGRVAEATLGGERAAAAALGALGARFRLHGRTSQSGLDCVGLAALAMRAGGYAGEVPSGYRLRGGDLGRVAAAVERLVAADGSAPGDLLLFRPGPGQLHLAVRTARGLVHADAALGRVVERPGADPWPLLGAWRLID